MGRGAYIGSYKILSNSDGLGVINFSLLKGVGITKFILRVSSRVYVFKNWERGVLQNPS